MIRSFFKKLPFFETAALIIILLALTQYLPELSMNMATAITFLICITSSVFFNYADVNKRLLLPARILSLLTIAIGLTGIAALVFKFIPLDNLFENGPEIMPGSQDDMAFISAFSFTIIGIALTLVKRGNPEKIYIPHLIALIILCIASLSVIAIFFHENTFASKVFYKPMEIGTAICFGLLAFSILLVHKRNGFFGEIFSKYQGGKIARALIPLAILLPVFIGLYQLRSQEARGYTRPFEIVVIVMVRIIILILFIWRCAVLINRSNKSLVAEIEEREKDAAMLRYRKALLEAQNEAIPDAILVVDTKGKILSSNRHFAEMWHIPKEIIDANNDTAALEFAMTRLEKPEEFINRVNYIYAHSEESAHDEILFKDGRIIERYGNPVMGDDGTKYGWAWYFRDITRNRNHENAIKDFSSNLEIKVKERTEKLNKSETRFRLLVENSSDIISLIDADGRFVYMSPSIKRLTGFAEEELVGRQAIGQFHKDDQENGLKWKTYLIKNPGITINNSFRFLCKDGGYIWIEGTATNMLYDDNVNAFVLNYRDITERKKGEESIRKNEMRFRSLVENSFDIISLIDFDGYIMYMSPSIKRLTGFTVEEMVGKSGFDLIHPDDVKGGKDFRLSIIATPSAPSHSSFRLLHKNGGYIWVEGTVTNMLNNENVNAFVLNYHDITERKNNEEATRKSEKRFRSLIENAHDIISLSDENGYRFYVSPAMESITGYTVEETISQPVFNIVHPDDVLQTKKLRDEFMNEPGVIKPISFRFMHKNGGFVWIEGSLVNLLQDENVKAVVGNFHDVTERKLSEEKVRITTERLQMVSKATNDAVWDWDLETDDIYWNDEVNSIFNYSTGDIATGAEWKIHIHPEDFKRVTKKLVYHVKNRVQNWQDEYRFRCADGTYKFVYNRGFILFNNNDKPYRIIGAMQDVTHINKLQQSLNDERIKKQKELTNANIEGQEKERTEIGRELHDNINQLLTAVKLYLDVAIKQPSMKDEMIRRSSENLSVCMEEIRRLSSALILPSTALNTFDDIMHDLLEPIKIATSIHVNYEVKGVDKIILTNHQQLNVYRIIQEHLNNIIKHSKANNVLITIKKSKGLVEIIIKDDGEGFDPTLRRKGIGFKNIQSRAELLDGKMKVASKPGEGCVLFVNFPIHQDV